MSTDLSPPASPRAAASSAVAGGPARGTPVVPGRTRAWIEVRGAALARNLARIRKVLEEASSHPATGGGSDASAAPGVIAMVKADAYGVGVAEAVTVLREAGVAGWGVATLDEALEVLALGVTEPVQIFSPLLPEAFVRAVEAGARPSLSDPELPAGLPTRGPAGASGRAEGGFDLEIDTGMGRAGVPLPATEALAAWAERLVDRLSVGPVVWVGVFTHLHSADEHTAAGDEAVAEQAARFRGAVAALDAARAARGLPPLRTHLANSGGALRFPRLAVEFDAVRPGIALYGGGSARDAGLDEVMAVRARVLRVVNVPAGTTAGYGATYRASDPERWATLGIGYGDGLPRALSNRAEVLLGGRRVPIVGRISMDMTVVNVSGVDEVQVGDVATVVGSDGEARISLDEVARWASTIDYEVMTGWSRRLPRVWIDEVEG